MQGHSHDGITPCHGHSAHVPHAAPMQAHTPPEPMTRKAHSHSHGGAICHGHGAHDVPPATITHAPGHPVPLPPPHEAHEAHAHSHGGKACHGHGGGHGHSHGDGSSGKWNPDVESWDSQPGAQEVSDHLVGLVTSQPFWKPSLKTLDFGCGTSLNLRKLALNHGLVDGTGADVEISMLVQLAKEIKASKLENQLTCKLLRSQEAEDLTGEYDLALTTTVFGHVRLPTVEKVMERLIASIRPGGHLMFCEMENVKDVAKFGGGEGEGEDKFVSDGGHVHTNFTEASVRELLEKNGMVVQVVDKFTTKFGTDVDINLMCLIAHKPEVPAQ